ncbi:MAG: hypothetical protein L0Z50_12310 [Verrucomicrobiales bacterium]|nr:hypothetical protein [Verrucomicrobiales bacterium]
MTFDERERAILADLADVLIPAGEGFPCASAAGVAVEGLDLVLACRPDLAAALKSILAFALGRNPRDTIAELKKAEPALFAALAEFVPGAYFLNEQVRHRLNYHGQNARPIDHRPDYLGDGLLQSVIDRGPIYRPTPGRELC